MDGGLDDSLIFFPNFVRKGGQLAGYSLTQFFFLTWGSGVGESDAMLRPTLSKL